MSDFSFCPSGTLSRRVRGHLPWNIRATAAVESDKEKVAQSHDARQSNLTGRYKAGTDPGMEHQLVAKDRGRDVTGEDYEQGSLED